MNCPKCGNVVPDGSAFCNKCGTPLNTSVACRHCGNEVPAGSVFCPRCGKMLSEASQQEETYNQRQERLRREQEAAGQEAARRQQEAEWRRQQEEMARQQATHPAVDPWEPGDDDEEGDDDVPQRPSHYNRNLLVGIAVVVVIIGLLLILRACGASESPRTADVVGDTTVTEVTQDIWAVFNNELSRNGMLTDGAKVAAARAIPARDGKPALIVGLTYSSDPTNRSFYKLYQLTQNGNTWTPLLLHTQYLNGRSLSFGTAELVTTEDITPRAVALDGGEYFYFAYVNMPQGSHVGGSGRVSLCAYDLDQKKLTTLDYEGIIRVRQDGRQYVYGKPLQSINSKVTRFLQSEAQNIKVIYFPTPEELEAERLAEEEAEQEAALEGPENAAARWSADNAENLASVKSGKEVKMKPQSYEKPIFKMEDKNKSIQNADYIVFSDTKGGVYGFNKNSRKYFVIYNPPAASTPTEIGFADSENSILNLRTSTSRLQYNLKSDQMKINE